MVNKILTNPLSVLFEHSFTKMWLDDSQCVPLSTRWRVEFQENLARKDAEEKMKMEELKAKAKKELEDW